ncbi:hypothetical protein Ngar_c00670 [Candidatus Nitrososphaera gargensis Ga9.2]|uniref:Uncharacterized protein n=1 Tax=Nitrososphaera gargensis (strain Ga9.2) TaxID=1237085 RepID=K0IGR9_NITGG|nr:hypothetical protein Ngar_c00670 [Candidatus Nitrososphaera gargensis Ga9.2]
MCIFPPAIQTQTDIEGVVKAHAKKEGVCLLSPTTAHPLCAGVSSTVWTSR